jgi:hypothetical protein
MSWIYIFESNMSQLPLQAGLEDMRMKSEEKQASI